MKKPPACGLAVAAPTAIWLALVSGTGGRAAEPAAPDPASRPLLTNAQQVLALPVEEARLGLPVKVRGVITFHEPAWFLTYVQDETAGVFVAAAKTGSPSPRLAVGDLVAVEGVTTPGRFAPYIDGRSGSNAVVRVLGRVPLPTPLPLSAEPRGLPAFHSQRVEIQGVARAITEHEGRVAVEIDTRAGRLKVMVPELSAGKPLPAELIGARVRARGVFGSIFNLRRQQTGMMLFVPSLDDLQIDQDALPDAFSLPVRPVHTLLQFRPEDHGYRARVQGVVTSQQPGAGLYIRDQGEGLWVQTSQKKTVAPGDWVDVVGFPSIVDFNPALQDAIFKPIRQGAPPQPLAVAAEAALEGGHHANLIRLEGALLEKQHSPEEQILTIQAGAVIFQARLPDARAPATFAALEEGSLLRLVGICIVKSEPTQPDRVGPRSFSLLLRGPADVTVLKRPSWWTPARVRRVLFISLGAVGVAVAWAVALGLQVRAQTAIIRQQIEREATHQERARIARELHDTLEQELIGITLQLDAAAARLDDSPPVARRSLDLARDMLRHSQAEARQSIWDLRSIALETGGLLVALKEMLQPLSNHSPLQVEILAKGELPPLPRNVEHGLLRIAQEAVTNTFKHSGAARVLVELECDRQSVSVRVTDNGRGFHADRSTSIEAGHFGLLGMRERAEKLNGTLEIRSQPGAGAVVSVRVPIPGLPKPA